MSPHVNVKESILFCDKCISMFFDVSCVKKFSNFSGKVCWLFIVFSVLAEQTAFEMTLITAIVCGYIRAATVINQNLTVSEYCTDEKRLPSALGLNMVGKGLTVLVIGQFFGKTNYVSYRENKFSIQFFLQVLSSWDQEIVLVKVTTLWKKVDYTRTSHRIYFQFQSVLTIPPVLFFQDGSETIRKVFPFASTFRARWWFSWPPPGA